MATDLREVSDEDLRLRCGEMTASELRACRAGYALAIAARPAQAGEVAGFVIGDGQGKRWRCWGESGPEWTTDRDAALRFSRREDAEAVARNDEDAWQIQSVGTPPAQAAVREGWRAEIRDNGFVAVVISPNGREWYGTELGDGWVWEIAHEMLSAARQPATVKQDLTTGDDATRSAIVKQAIAIMWDMPDSERIEYNEDLHKLLQGLKPEAKAGADDVPKIDLIPKPTEGGAVAWYVRTDPAGLIRDAVVPAADMRKWAETGYVMRPLVFGETPASAPLDGLKALTDRIAAKRRDGSADSHWLATLELDLRAFGAAGLHAPTSWSDRVDGEPAQMLVRPGIGATAKCTCDGARYEPDQRHPFLINRSCPVHGASQAPPESTKTGGAPGPECAFGTSGLELAPLGGPSDSSCGGGT